MDPHFLNPLSDCEKSNLMAMAMNQENQTPYTYPYPHPHPHMHVPVICHSDPSSMREIIYHMAAMQPVEWIDHESVKPPKRRNVKISADPQSVAARLRRERISEKMRTLQKLVPGGTKMDTASMLDEAVNYMRFLKRQVQLLEMEMQASPSANYRCIGHGVGRGGEGEGEGGYFSGFGDNQTGSASSGSDQSV